MRKKQPKKKQQQTKTLRDKLDSLFSKYIRLSYADKDGYVSCFTCEKRAHFKEMDNGHFVSRSCLSLRYSEKNCHPQCRFCNRFREGMKDVYSIRLMEKYGKNILFELNKDKQKIVKNYPYAEEIERYTKKLRKFKHII